MRAHLTACLGVLAAGLPAAPGSHAAPAAPGGPTSPVVTSPVVTSSVVLANHRAVYDLALADSRGTRSVESARGRIVIDFRGDACRGYTMLTRQVTELTSAETGARLSDMRSTTFEGGQGREFRFKSTTLTDGKAAAPVEGSAADGGDGLTVRLKGAKPVTAEGPVLFPSLHMRRLIEAARSGATTLSAKVYDGSDDGRKVYDTFAVIGRAGGTLDEGRDKPLREGVTAGMPRWPVRLSYYTAGAGERTPIYILGFDLYENGVSGALRLDYGEFAIVGDLTTLDMAKAAPGGTDGGRRDGDKADAGAGCTP